MTSHTRTALRSTGTTALIGLALGTLSGGIGAYLRLAVQQPWVPGSGRAMPPMAAVATSDFLWQSVVPHGLHVAIVLGLSTGAAWWLARVRQRWTMRDDLTRDLLVYGVVFLWILTPVLLAGHARREVMPQLWTVIVGEYFFTLMDIGLAQWFIGRWDPPRTDADAAPGAVAAVPA